MADQFSRSITVGSEDQGNFALALLAGLLTAAVGAVLWVNDVSEDVHLHVMAIVIGLLVGLAVRFAGHGSGPVFGLLGALFTLAGCFAGEILAMLYRQVSPVHDFYQIATTADYAQLTNALVGQISATNYVIYAIALVLGYVLSMAR
jgi:hypothetical protein